MLCRNAYASSENPEGIRAVVSPPGHHLLGLQMLHRPSTWLEATCTSTSPAFAHHPHTGHVRYHHVSTMPPRIVGSTTTRETDDARVPHARFQSCSQHTMETHGVPLPMHALVALPTARSKQPYMSRRKARYGSRTTPHVGEIEHKTVVPRGPTPHTRNATTTACPCLPQPAAAPIPRQHGMLTRGHGAPHPASV